MTCRASGRISIFRRHMGGVFMSRDSSTMTKSWLFLRVRRFENVLLDTYLRLLQGYAHMANLYYEVPRHRVIHRAM